jgi:hypothetical protein
MHINFCPLLLDYPFEKTLMLPAFLCRKQYDIRYLLRLAEPCGTICLWRQNSYYPVIICLCCIPPLSLFYLFILLTTVKGWEGAGGGQFSKKYGRENGLGRSSRPCPCPRGSSHGSPVLGVQSWESSPGSPALGAYA